METLSALLAICAGNSPVPAEFPAQRPVARGFDVSFDLHPSKRLSKQSWGWWFATPSRSFWRHCNGIRVKRWVPWFSVGCTHPYPDFQGCSTKESYKVNTGVRLAWESLTSDTCNPAAGLTQRFSTKSLVFTHIALKLPVFDQEVVTVGNNALHFRNYCRMSL